MLLTKVSALFQTMIFINSHVIKAYAQLANPAVGMIKKKYIHFVSMDCAT